MRTANSASTTSADTTGSEIATGRFEKQGRTAKQERYERPSLAATIRGSLLGRVCGKLHKDSSLIAASRGLRRFREDFAGRSLDISRTELKDWMNGEGIWAHKPAVPRGYRPTIVALYNHATAEDDVPLARSPARKLGCRSPERTIPVGTTHRG